MNDALSCSQKNDKTIISQKFAMRSPKWDAYATLPTRLPLGISFPPMTIACAVNFSFPFHLILMLSKKRSSTEDQKNVRSCVPTASGMMFSDAPFFDEETDWTPGSRANFSWPTSEHPKVLGHRMKLRDVWLWCRFGETRQYCMIDIADTGCKWQTISWYNKFTTHKRHSSQYCCWWSLSRICMRCVDYPKPGLNSGAKTILRGIYSARDGLQLAQVQTTNNIHIYDNSDANICSFRCCWRKVISIIAIEIREVPGCSPCFPHVLPMFSPCPPPRRPASTTMTSPRLPLCRGAACFRCTEDKPKKSHRGARRASASNSLWRWSLGKP